MLKSFAVMDDSECTSDTGKENESLGDHILEEMESFWVDMDERLTISRMVSDSVIKGMVNAVEQQAAERIAQKELEVVELKKMLHNFHVDSGETKSSGHLVPYHEHQDQVVAAQHFSCSVVENDRPIVSVDGLRSEINEQLMQLKKEINKVREPSSIRKISSGSDLVGLSGFLQENVPERWICVDKTFESLKGTLDTFCRRMEVTDQLAKGSLHEWQEEQEFRSEIEQMVISNCVWSLQQEFEEKLGDLYDSESRNCLNQHKEISCLRQELDSFFKTLSVSETGQLISHGSLENGEERCHHKRADHFHRKISTNHLSPSTLEENGKQINNPENLDPASLKHMSRDELISYYNSEITKMKRNHESQVQEITEENFRLMRELLNLKERGSSLPLRKDKDFDLLKKRIPDIISKLDKIIVENEKVHQFNKNFESLSSLKDRLNYLHLENHQLQDMLTDKKKELKGLSSQLSVALENLSQKHQSEKNLVLTIQKLEDAIGDANAEVSVIQDVYKCLFEDITSEFRCTTEELHLKNSIMEEIYEIIFKETAQNAQASSRVEIEEAEMEWSMTQGLLDINHIIFKEALVDADKALKLEASKTEELNKQMVMLKSIVKEKEKLAQEAADGLVVEKQTMESASQELNSLRAQTIQLQKLIAENKEELDVTQGDLDAALKEIEQCKSQMHKLHQNLIQKMNELREIDEERRVLLAVTQEKQNSLTLIEAKERKTRKQMESTIDLIHKLLTMVTDFESRVNEDISRNCLRLENMRSEFCCISDKANILKTMGLVYKQRLETKCSDFEKAEAEVDLLGDEVDTLLSLLEKIYIALDHYSPILQHYPGIIEILELIRRELSGGSRKLV